MRRRTLLAAALLATTAATALVTAPAGAQTEPAACTTSWATATSGSWSDAARWTAGAPDAHDVACIAVTGTYTVSVSATRTTGAVRLGDGTAGSTPTLAVGTPTAAAHLYLDSVAVAAGATLRVAGPLDQSRVQGATTQNDGTIDLADGTELRSAVLQGPTGRIHVVLGQRDPKISTWSNAIGGTIRVTTTVPRPYGWQGRLVECNTFSSPCSAWDTALVPTIELVGQELTASGSFFGNVELSAQRSRSERFVAGAEVATRGYFVPYGLPGQNQIAIGADLDAGRTTRRQVVERLQSGSNGWALHHIEDLYEQILGRTPPRSEVEWWLAQVQPGRITVDKMAALLYGSPEYSAAHGGSDTNAWVTAMYEGILGRAPDPAGQAYWAAEADARGRGLVAQRIYRSTESLRRRVGPLFERILDRAPAASERAYWGERLGRFGTRRLEADLIVSGEFDALAWERYPL